QCCVCLTTARCSAHPSTPARPRPARSISTHPQGDIVSPDPTVRPTKVLVPTGMLGAGFTPESIDRGIELGADVLALDGGSTDSGPYYLGAATAKTTERAVAHDLRILLVASRRAGIPLIVGTCGTSGTDAGVDWIARIVSTIAEEEGLYPTIARIYSEQSTTVI